MKKYYHITIRIAPYMCRDYYSHAVISEDPLDFICRQEDREGHKDHVEVIQTREISETMYDKFKNRNPAKRDPKYTLQAYHMNDKDWGNDE